MAAAPACSRLAVRQARFAGSWLLQTASSFPAVPLHALGMASCAKQPRVLWTCRQGNTNVSWLPAVRAAGCSADGPWSCAHGEA